MRVCRSMLWMPLLALTALGCGDDGGAGPDAGDAGTPDSATPADGGVDAWTPPRRRPWAARPGLVPDGDFVRAHASAFARISGWATGVEGPVDGRPDVGHRGSYGVGNGHAFAFFGLADPMNTMHSLTTPTYERRPTFFGDYAIGLAPAGDADTPDFEREQVTRSLSAPVVLTRASLGDLRLDTLDFAPVTDDVTLQGCMIRVLTVTNEGATEAPLYELRVLPANDTTSPEPDLLLEVGEQRALTSYFVDGTVSVTETADARWLTRQVGPLAPGASEQTVLLHCGAEGAGVARPAVVDAGALIDATAADYQAWESSLLQVTLPEPLVADYIDGMKMTLRVQTASTGASCPMSQYTRTWARDNTGPTLALLDFGAYDDVRAMMDYIYGAVVRGGDLSNSYDADLDLSSLPPEPDWNAMPPLSGRVGAETPSYMVLIYGEYLRHTGLLERVRDRFGFLRRCMLAQDFGPDGLLPFTGDETFRAAMNATFNLPLEFPHQDRSYSANSALLWLGAAGQYLQMADALGLADDRSATEARISEVEAGFATHYALPDGCVSPFQDRMTRESWPTPFEDVSLKMTWAGWRDGDSPEAQANMQCLIDDLERYPGVYRSLAAERYRNYLLLPRMDGVYTGMLPGYTLSALTAVGHPDAAAAFDEIGVLATSSGNAQEYQAFLGTDEFGLTAAYDDTGAIGDYTSKFRPWEGGINVHAVLGYLVGFEPDARTRSFALRPHLPEGWPSMAFRGLRSGDARFDLELERLADGYELRLTSRAADDQAVQLRWDADASETPSFEVDGAPVASADISRVEHFGQQSLSLPVLSLPAGGTLRIVVRQSS
ncbi:MAG: hypothetical protein GXP55_03570 [Deltaproteobacteria bacterium]|nr:hypothetical protein [Deltaproteobacteria bacterium]